MADTGTRPLRASILPDPGLISLARGIPAPETLPVQELARCAQRALERHGPIALNYGDPEGFRPLCQWLAERHGVSAEQVLVTPGSFVGLSFIVRELLGASGRAAVEAPCYDRMVTLLGTGAETATVVRTADGLDLDRVRELFAGGSRPAFLYVLPTFHNPTGLTMTLRQREQLADLAVELEIVVLEDDPYGLLRLEGEPLPHVHALLHARGADRLAIHVSSFSKSVSPGLRVGYVVGSEALIERLRERAIATYVSPPMLAQAELYEYLRAGYLESHLEQLRAFLRPRRDALLEVFAERMPAEACWTRPAGGYFVWLELPRNLDASTFADHALVEGVSIVPGHGFFPGNGGEHAARLSFSFPSVQQIRAGALRLAELVRR
jgi:2-aminoadipate transaminase